jgi:hypothetical protein
MKTLLIKYIGNDKKYWEKVKQNFRKDYGHINLRFIEKEVVQGISACDLFISTYYENPDIIYVDLSFESAPLLSLLKLLCKNNVLRVKSTVALHEYRAGRESLLKSILAGVRINHFKSNEILDVVFDPMTLLDVNLPNPPEVAVGKELGKLSFNQILRLGFVDDDHMRVETNSPLEIDEMIELNSHPLEEVMPSKRFLVEAFSDTDLYYNQRFSYKLKYTYLDTPFFRSTEDNWKMYKKYKNNPLGYEEDTKKEYKYLVEDMGKRREKFQAVKADLKKWIADKEVSIIPKRLKILVIDETLEMFKEVDGKPEEFPYSINFQTHCTQSYYQVRRTKPHLIVIHYEENGNNFDVMSDIIKVVKEYEDYEPVILCFNSPIETDDIIEKVNYKRVISYKGNLDIKVVKEFASKLDGKFKISNVSGKVFYKTSDKSSVLTLTREAKVLSFSESMIHFQTSYKIPMWSTFIVYKPERMLMTVVPHREDSQYKGQINTYSAFIHGVGEKEKARLRVLVNQSLDEE